MTYAAKGSNENTVYRRVDGHMTLRGQSASGRVVVGGEVGANQATTSDVDTCTGRDQHVELLETITARAK